MKYGKIVGGKVYVIIETSSEVQGQYSGHLYYNSDGSLKAATTVIEEQKLKPIHVPENCKEIGLYKFKERATEIIVYDELTEEGANLVNARELAKIRARRERECFPIINRGKIWYETINEVQQNELRGWYQAWLDAPQTRVIPVKPSWL